MNHQLVRTRQGHLAIRDVQAGEVMHPGVGALAEARLLYVQQSRLAERLSAGDTTDAPLVLFDVGLGAGTNALAAREASERLSGLTERLRQLFIISFERDLGALELALTQPEDFGLQGDSGIAARALLQSGRHESPRTSWRLAAGDLLQALAVESARADIVFWDPFSPRANPTLWTVAAFRQLRAVAGPTCTLFTYSASTAVRVALLLAGWAVGIGDPIGEKAQTTAAAIRAHDLVRPLDRRWLSRLDRPDAPLPADAPADARQLAAAAPQFR